jgi:hypothetical protein
MGFSANTDLNSIAANNLNLPGDGGYWENTPSGTELTIAGRKVQITALRLRRSKRPSADNAVRVPNQG